MAQCGHHSPSLKNIIPFPKQHLFCIRHGFWGNIITGIAMGLVNINKRFGGGFGLWYQNWILCKSTPTCCTVYSPFLFNHSRSIFTHFQGSHPKKQKIFTADALDKCLDTLSHHHHYYHRHKQQMLNPVLIFYCLLKTARKKRWNGQG